MSRQLKGAWVSLDGVEGVGKTSLANMLGNELDVTVTPEFSYTEVGQALARAVAESPHYISVSRLGQSLSFLGDFFEIHEAIVVPAVESGKVVLSDRGYISKYAYQVAVLEPVVGQARAQQLVHDVLSLLPHPDLTLYLHAPIGVLKHRLIARDGHCSFERLSFMKRADRAARARLGLGVSTDFDCVEVDTNRELRDVVEDVGARLRSHPVIGDV